MLQRNKHICFAVSVLACYVQCHPPTTEVPSCAASRHWPFRFLSPRLSSPLLAYLPTNQRRQAQRQVTHWWAPGESSLPSTVVKKSSARRGRQTSSTLLLLTSCGPFTTRTARSKPRWGARTW